MASGAPASRCSRSRAINAFFEKVRFLLGGGGEGAGASDERVLSKFFTYWGGSVLFYSQPGEGHSLFCKDKITPCRFYFVYTSKATCQD